MSPIHIIIDEVASSNNEFNLIELLQNSAEVLSTIIAMWVMIIGIRTVNRLHLKSEDAIFNFFSRWIIYLETLKESIGTAQKSVLYYMYVDDIRNTVFTNQTPTQDELTKFKELTSEILRFLENTDGQFSITKNYYEQEKTLVKYLVRKCKNLGETHPFASNDQSKVNDIIQDLTTIINAIIDEIDWYTKKTLKRHWKKNKRK